MINVISTEDFHNLININKHHLEKLHEIVAKTGEPLEGNCFYLHQTLNTDARLVNKQRNIYSLACVSQQILEIGFNAGHSSLIMLLANPQAEITAFDICCHKYTRLCFDYLAEVFPGRIELIPGSSTETIPLYYQQHPEQKFDLLHIDGSHEKEIANSDFYNCMQLAKHESYVIWDDVQSSILKGLWDEYVKLGYVQPVVDMLETYLYQHVVGQYLIPPQPVQTITKIDKLINSLSVIIPAYNCEKYITRTIESIIKSLDYFHSHYPLAEKVKSEIIVVNDCSTDNTTFFVSQFIGKKYPVKLVNHSINQGAGPARNTGFKSSQGEILFFCDGDDLFLPAHIYVCFMLLQGQYDEKNSFPLAQTNYQSQVNFLEQPVDAIKTKVKIDENIHPGWQQGIENSLPLNLCVRRNCHEFLEGFPEDPIYKKIGGAEDSAYYRYLCQFFKIAYVNLVTVEYIRYPGNSLDRQMLKFSQAPGAYQGYLPHEKPELFAESRAIEQQRLEVLKAKYQQYSLEFLPRQANNVSSTVIPVWKTEYEEFCQTKKFQYTQDWFSHNIPIWSQVLQRFVNQPNINFLEVGSWEGRSTCWLLGKILTHPSAKITCVDTFVGSVEHQNYESVYLQSLEERFDFNITQTGFANKVEKQKGSSQNVLRSLPLDHYDFYYVDGSHLAPDVLEDIILGWRLMKVNSMIIFDDYNLKLSEKITENVKLAVDAFYTVFQDKIQVLHQGYQVIVEKIRD